MKIAFNPTIDRLAVLGDSALTVYDVSTGGASHHGSHPIEASGHRLVADGDGIAVVSGRIDWSAADDARLTRLDWDLTVRATLDLNLAVQDLAISPDGRRIAVADRGKTCSTLLVDATTGEILAGSGAGIPSGVSWAPDGSRILSGTGDQGGGDLTLYTVAGDELAGTDLSNRAVETMDATYCSAFSPDGSLVAVTGTAWGTLDLAVFDTDTLETRWSSSTSNPDTEPRYSYPVLFFPDGTTVFTGRPGGVVHAFRTADGGDLGAVDTGSATVDGFAVDPARRTVWTIGTDGAPVATPMPATWPA